MNKNVVIWVLVIIILGGFGFYLLSNKNGSAPAYPAAPTTTTSGTTPAVQNTPAQTPDSPVVETDSNNSAYISTAVLMGTVNPNGASTTYWYEYGPSSAFGNQTNPQSIGSGYFATPTPGYISGLQQNTLYYYRLVAKNRFDTVNGATYTFQTNGTPPPPVVKTTVHTQSATNISRTSATLNGQVNPNGVATNYWFEYGTNTDFGFVTQFQATNSGTSFMSVPTQISGLSPLTKYYFRLNADNQFGTVNGPTLSFTTSGPVNPSQPTVQTSSATKIGTTTATFAGHINPNGADTTYWFEYSTDSTLSSGTTSTSGGTLAGSTSQNVQVDVTGLQSNTKYYYRLVGSNSSGSVNGSIVSFTTKK